MSELHLHIVSFDIPYPPNYGGVIDVFYKIKALHAAGVKVHLHCFEYHREPAKELDELCEVVHYYPRKTGVVAALSWKPYIVFGRRSDELLKTLCRDDFPILFEGLHSCYYLSHPSLKNRIKIYRESNIEHHYYFHLSKVEKNFFKKIGKLGHATRALHSPMEGFDGKTSDLPLREPGGGPAVRLWARREGKAANVHADV